MKIWFISDTHCEHENLEVPEVDAVIHCGDESNHGNPWMNEAEARNFFEWYSALPIPLKIFVPGNHSTAIEQGLVRGPDYPAVKFLIHESTEWNELMLFQSHLALSKARNRQTNSQRCGQRQRQTPALGLRMRR